MLLYTYVNRPWEDPAHPNAVDLPAGARGSAGASSLSLAALLQLLPAHDRARSGLFVRARVVDSNFGYIWKDLTDASQPVPMVGDNVICRVGFHDELRNTSERAPMARPGVTQSQAAAPRAAAGAAAPSARAAAPISSSAPVASVAAAAGVPRPPAKAMLVPQATAEEPRKRKQEPVEGDQDDGLDPDERAKRRIEAREAAEAAERDRKVAEVRDAEEKKTSEHDARAQAWAELRPALEQWSGSDANRKPVRALLSNLHTVLWEDAKWTPVSVLVRPNEVRLAYRKAMLVVHPDKVPKGAPIKQMVIAKHCFEALNSAYEKFEKAEMA